MYTLLTLWLILSIYEGPIQILHLDCSQVLILIFMVKDCLREIFTIHQKVKI